MRAKMTYVLIAILAVLGGLNIFQSLKDKLLPAPEMAYAESGDKVIAYTDGREKSLVYFAEGDVLIDKTFTVSEGDRLDIRVEHTEVEVEIGGNDEAHIRVTMEARDMDRAREVFEKMDFRVEERGGVVSVEADWPERNWSGDRMGGVEFTVHATIPARFDATINTSHGDLKMGALTGMINIKTSHGDVDADALRGPEIRVTTSHGDVELEGLFADDVRVKTSHGDIDIGTVESETFEAHTSHADIEVERLTGRVEMSNSHGDIQLRMTGSYPAVLKTTHGNIVLTMPGNTNADLNLKGGDVRLDSAFRFDGEIKDDRAEGRVGNGGPMVEARTTHGSITLRND